MQSVKKKAVVVHSGGMDSSLCLALAIEEFGSKNVMSLTFSYGQRHSIEIELAENICKTWGVDHVLLDIHCLNQITENALTRHSLSIESGALVVGRNGLMARIAAIHAHSLGAKLVYMGVIEVESANSGYRDCSRDYMNKMEEILRIDLGDPQFEIRTPLVFLTKDKTMEVGYQLGVLKFLLENTVTCYQGVIGLGCENCPACRLRNEGIARFLLNHRDFEFSYVKKFQNYFLEREISKE